MKIYFSHPRSANFQGELYEPIRGSGLNNEHEFILPHEQSDEPFSSKEAMRDFDLVIAEVSEKATGVGIELGWADAAGVPIACVHHKNAKPSNSLSTVSVVFETYDGPDELIEAIHRCIDRTKANLTK